MVDLTTRSAQSDPLTTAKYRCIIAGDTSMLQFGFHRISGIEVTEETLNYNPGVFDFMRKVLSGVRDTNTVTLEEAYVDERGRNSLVEWYNLSFAPTSPSSTLLLPRRSASIYLVNRGGSTSFLFTLRNAVPVRFRFFPDLDGTTPEIATCEVELAHEGCDALPVNLA